MLEIALPYAPEHSATAAFELNGQFTVLGAAQPTISGYSQAERTAASPTLRTVEVLASPSRIVGAAAATPALLASLACHFSIDRAFAEGGLPAVGAVVELLPRAVSAAHGQRVDTLRCEYPVMEAQTARVYVRLGAALAPPDADRALLDLALPGGGFKPYTIQSQGAAHLQVLALPYLTSVHPLVVFNLASVSSLAVTGENFHFAGGGLVCLLAGAPPATQLYQSRASFTSSTEVACPFAPPASLLREHTLYLRLSNDDGLTQSENALELSVAPSLPRLLALTSPRVLFAGRTASLTFAGSSLGSLGSQVQLRIGGLATVGAGVQAGTSVSCTPSLPGSLLDCADVPLPACPAELPGQPGDGCLLRLSLLARDSDPASEVRQSLTLTAHAPPTILALAPSEADSSKEHVQPRFDSPLLVAGLARLDAGEGCCLDPVGDPPCGPRCRVECRVYTPGREAVFSSPLVLDGSGAPGCALPTHNHAQLSCSDEVAQLEVEVVIDSYFIVPSRSPWLGCLRDTVVAEATGPLQVLYSLPEAPLGSQRVRINGTNFRPGPGGQEARCTLYDPSGAPVLSSPVDYRPELDPTQLLCLVGGSRGQIGALRPGLSYTVKYTQRGEEHPAQYQVLVLSRPRLLGVQSRLVSEAGSIVVRGEGFSPQVGYLCQYRERGLGRTSSGGSAASFQPLFAPATQVLATEVTCPPISEVATYLRPASGEGFRCLDILLKDPDSGLVFRAEPGSPAEKLASTCLITGVEALVAAGPPSPQRVPLAAANTAPVPAAERELLLPLVEDSAILGLLASLGEPLGAARLRFQNVVVVGPAAYELMASATVAALTSPELLEVDCVASRGSLRCSPWPYVTATDPGHLTSALSLALSTPLNSPAGRIELHLSQELEFFPNIMVSAWSPAGSLLQTVDNWVTVEGSDFVEEAALECLYYEVGLEALGPSERAPAKWEGGSRVQCHVPASLFKQTALEVALHLSRDGGRTLEAMVGAALGDTMQFSLRRAPQITRARAFTASGEPVSKSLFVGRPEVLTLRLEGIHLDSAEGRDPVCKFTGDNGKVLLSTATILHAGAASCAIPAVPWTLEPGLRDPGTLLIVTLLLEADGAEFAMVQAAPPTLQLRAREDAVWLLRAPSILAATVSHESWPQHGALATVDRPALELLVAADPDAEILFTLDLADAVCLEEAARHGRSLLVVVAPAAGQAAALTSPARVDPAAPGPRASASIRADAFLGAAPPPLGAYRIGLVPQTEVSQASAAEVPQLVAGDAPTLLFVDSSFLLLEALEETPTRLPTAPGFTNHVPVRVSAASADFGAALHPAVPLISSALVSKQTAPYPAGQAYFASYALVVPDGWGSGASPSALTMDFIFDGAAESAILHDGLYCVKLAFNGLLSSRLCQPADLEVTVFHLPADPHSRRGKPCRVVKELADFAHLDRNFAARVAVVDGALQYEQDTDGSLLCRFDSQVYDYFQRLYHIELRDRPPAPWELQAILADATSENVTDLALGATSGQLAGKVFFRSHLAEIVDDHLPPAPDELPSSGVFHPGETIHVRGYFLDNSPLGVVLRLTHLAGDSAVISGLEACRAHGNGQFEAKCALPPAASFSSFGEFLVGLEEQGTGQLLSDDHGLLVLLVLPVPEILGVTPGEAAVSSLTGHGDAERGLLQLRVDFGWGPASGTQALEAFRQDYLGQVRCRLGALGAQLSTNLTWTAPAQLACYFGGPAHLSTPAYHCVEVSFNGGRSYTTDCPKKVGTTRAPVVTGFEPAFSLIADPTTFSVRGVGFDPLVRYWCLFSGPGADESLQEATYGSSSEIECQKPLAGTTAASHRLELSLYLSPDWPAAGGQQSVPLLVKRFELPHENRAFASLLSVLPDRGDSLGGTLLEFTLENNPLAWPEHADLIECRFSAVIAGSPTTAVEYSPAHLIDEQHLGCVTPDFTAHFSPGPAASTIQEVYVSVSELDGTFRQRSELRFRYFARPEILELSPGRGFATRVTQVQVLGRNFLNFEDLAVRAVGVPSESVDVVELTWRGSEVLLTDPGTLLIEMPAAATPRSRRTGGAVSVRLEVSLNGGEDWATSPLVDPPLFTFLDEPQVVSLSHAWSNLRGGFPLTLRILHLRFRAGCPVPAEASATCAEAEDLAYCRIGSTETVLRHVNETHAECTVPAQAEEMVATVALRTLGGEYFGTGSQREAATLRYVRHSRITGVRPTEGPAAGGQLAWITGNFSRVPAADALTVEFGGEPVLEVIGRTDSEVAVRVPALALLAGEAQRLVSVAIRWDRTGLLLLNESVHYTYRVYPTLTHVWPAHGPGAGGTLIELHGTGLDQRGLCQLESAAGGVVLVQPLWTSPELLLCEAPRRTPGIVAVELTFGDGAYTTPSGATYTYDPDPHVHSVNATHLALSAFRAGVRLGLTGLHFLDTPDLAVKIGDSAMPATFITSSYIAFAAPPVQQAGCYPIEITTNAADFTQASAPVELCFHGGFTVDGLSLSRLQVEEGKTLSITAFGRGLPTAEVAGDLELYCVLTPFEPADAFERVTLPAGLVSEDGTSVRCDGVPASYSKDGVPVPGPYRASLAFSYDLQELLWAQPLDYYAAPELHEVEPAMVSQGAAELVLAVSAAGLPDGGGEAKCRLDPAAGSSGASYYASRVLY